MYMTRKKDVLQELAVTLYLTQHLSPDTTALSVINRVRERAAAALKAAEFYTGKIGEPELREFLSVKLPRFSVDCKNNIIKDDIIRFQEQVFNNKLTPPRQIGIRGVIAKVICTSITAKKQMLYLRVIQSGGVWSLKPGEEIRRTLRIVTRMEVMRAPWEDESVRSVQKGARPQIKEAKRRLTQRDRNTTSK